VGNPNYAIDCLTGSRVPEHINKAAPHIIVRYRCRKQLEDPALSFERACLAFHMRRTDRASINYYAVPTEVSRAGCRERVGATVRVGLVCDKA
jgi:hypothetical protein